jgi:GMP synthase-like glutamine amidotransferase
VKPVAVLRFSAPDGPGRFASWLEARGTPWVMVPIDAGAAVPPSPREFSGLCLMGGPMSVNHAPPWLGPVLELVRLAVREGVPVIGHCLGGQILAKALGAEVTRASVVEIGWTPVSVAPQPESRDWFGGASAFTTFSWHNETFALPPGARGVLSSEHCANQAFVLGPHLGLQCHVEVTAPIVRAWCASGAAEIERCAGPGVQPVAQVLEDVDVRAEALGRVAQRLYERWAQGLAA